MKVTPSKKKEVDIPTPPPPTVPSRKSGKEKQETTTSLSRSASNVSGGGSSSKVLFTRTGTTLRSKASTGRPLPSDSVPQGADAVVVSSQIAIGHHPQEERVLRCVRILQRWWMEYKPSHQRRSFWHTVRKVQALTPEQRVERKVFSSTQYCDAARVIQCLFCRCRFQRRVKDRVVQYQRRIAAIRLLQAWFRAQNCPLYERIRRARVYQAVECIQRWWISVTRELEHRGERVSFESMLDVRSREGTARHTLVMEERSAWLALLVQRREISWVAGDRTFDTTACAVDVDSSSTTTAGDAKGERCPAWCTPHTSLHTNQTLRERSCLVCRLTVALSEHGAVLSNAPSGVGSSSNPMGGLAYWSPWLLRRGGIETGSSGRTRIQRLGACTDCAIRSGLVGADICSALQIQEEVALEQWLIREVSCRQKLWRWESHCWDALTKNATRHQQSYAGMWKWSEPSQPSRRTT